MSLNRLFFKRAADYLALQELQSMSDYSLDDIGLSRIQVLYPSPKGSLRKWVSRRRDRKAEDQNQESQA